MAFDLGAARVQISRNCRLSVRSVRWPQAIQPVQRRVVDRPSELQSLHGVITKEETGGDFDDEVTDHLVLSVEDPLDVISG